MGTGLRGPEAQGRLWSRGKSFDEVAKQAAVLEPLAPLLTSYLTPEHCALGPTSLISLPGHSWHQWGEAADLYAIVAGRAVWAGSPCDMIRDVALDVGLFWGGRLYPKRQWHVQLRKDVNPMMIRGFCDTWGELEREMQKRFDMRPKPILPDTTQDISDTMGL